MLNSQGGRGHGAAFDPSDFLDWLPKPDLYAGTLTAENVEARFRAALEKAGHADIRSAPHATA